jgi:drug/metabolite transporter (DMT)-like permease
MENKTYSDSEVCAPGRLSLRQMMKSVVWLAVTTALYVVMFRLLKRHPEWSPGWRVAATLTPLLPGVFYLLSLLQSFRAMDELQRRIQLEAWIFALAGTVVVTTVMNVLNANGIGPANYPHGLQIGGVYMTMFLFWSIGVAISTLRYR